jgi:hypothetical protein
MAPHDRHGDGPRPYRTGIMILVSDRDHSGRWQIMIQVRRNAGLRTGPGPARRWRPGPAIQILSPGPPPPGPGPGRRVTIRVIRALRLAESGCSHGDYLSLAAGGLAVSGLTVTPAAVTVPAFKFKSLSLRFKPGFWPWFSSKFELDAFNSLKF